MLTETNAQERIDIRTTHEIKSMIARAAATKGMSVSSFLIQSAQERAKEILNESELVTLSADDWEAFFNALDHYDKPRPKLAEALREHQAWVKGKVE